MLDIDMKLDKYMSTVRAICIKYVPKNGPSTHKNIIPRDRRILMRRGIRISNRFNKNLNESMKFQLTEKLFEIETKLEVSHEKKVKKEKSGQPKI